jgi:hypothetical protein
MAPATELPPAPAPEPELDPYMSTTPTGLHLLAAPQRPAAMEEMTPELYGGLPSFLGRFYHVILLDLGTGLTEPSARFALERADQALEDVLRRLGGHQLWSSTRRRARPT